ncbi:MAG: hypothetical protein V4559_02360 [Pseudomonadota bacterium]
MKPPTGLPKELREKFESIDVISAPGESFNPSGGRRYMFAWNRGSRWIVAIEAGGGAYTQRVFAYELSKDGKSAHEIKTEFADVSSGAVCTTAARIAKE